MSMSVAFLSERSEQLPEVPFIITSFLFKMTDFLCVKFA